ncbi:hypothetical protein BG005_007274 [Podila minutissima]|nr:hypothetical protein BG005_007274 [Podila minutissima]
MAASTPVVLIGTFNMAQRPIEQDLSDWLSTHPSLSSDAPASPVSSNRSSHDVASAPGAVTPLIPDIVAVAVQEMAPYPDAFIHDTYNLQDKVNELANVIMRTLHRTCPGYRFSLISQSTQVGLALFILTRDGSMTEHIEKISNASVGTGPYGMGNKGAVATKISVHMPSSSSVPYPQEALQGQEQHQHDPHTRPFEICIINAHLSAHLNQIQRRNEDYLAICKRMVFFDDRENQVEGLLEEHQERLLSNLASSSFSSSVDSFDDSQSDLYQDNDSRPLLPKKRTPKNSVSRNSNFYQNNTTSANKSKRRNSKDKKDIQWEESIFSCDYIFWTGDLNYRLDLAQSDGSTTKKKKKKASSSSEDLLSQPTLPDLTPAEIVQTIQAGHFRKLYSHDQLSAQRKTMNVFRDFHEAPLAFAPTYKFKMGSNQYNYTKRVPAWTDRVLWYVHPRTESSFDEEQEDELDAWDEHSQGLGVGTLPMEPSLSTSGALLANGRRRDNYSSASTSTAATANQYGGWTGSKSRGTFSSLAKKGNARSGVHPGVFQPPSTTTSVQQNEGNKGPRIPSAISTNSLASMSSRSPLSQSPTSTVGAASSVHLGQTSLGAATTSPLLIHYYTSHPMYQSSDHKPVSALFTLLPQHLASQVGAVPYAIDPSWRRKKWFGKKLTTIVGHMLRWGFVVLGVGLVIGLIVLVRKHLHRW